MENLNSTSVWLACSEPSSKGQTMHACEFQNISTGESFGYAELPDRCAAEGYALTALVKLGENADDVRLAAAMAGPTWEDIRADGYGIRIFEK